MQPLFRLDGKSALITGAAHGIGLATARLFATQGARVAIADLDIEKAREAASNLGDGARAFRADVASVDECRSLALAVAEQFGSIDILVNNAGICPRVSFADASELDWDTLMNVNAKSQYFLMQAVVPIMRRQRGGRIINLASVAGRVGSALNASIYSATKGAVAMMTKSIAREVAADGILVNCVAPGLIATDILNDRAPDRLAKSVESIPLGRLGKADEVASLIAFLASDECSYSTGATFDISGGWVML
jgi:NAD(P)-dependent dehydrogenase (short-subunit alcohol dehydrogenase family)